MPAMWENFVSEIGAAPGSGAVTLAGANPDIPCMTFLTAGYATGDWVYYVITDGAANGKSEQCMGQFNATAGTLSRATTFKTNTGGTTPLNFTTTVKVFAYPPASRIAYFDNNSNLRCLQNIVIPNGYGYSAKDSAGTDQLLLQFYTDNNVNMFVSGGAGKKWRVLNQAGSAELLGVDDSGNANLAGSFTLGSTLLMPNSTAVRAKDTGGTYRNVMELDAVNSTTHFVAGGAGTKWRVVNQSFVTELFGVDNSGNTNTIGNATVGGNFDATGYISAHGNLYATGISTLSGVVNCGSSLTTFTNIQAGTGFNGRFGTTGALDGHLFNLYFNGSGVNLLIDTSDLGVISTSSDRRIKHHIASNAPGALARVMSLRPVIYRFAEVGIFRDDGVTRVGFIADEVQTTIPSAVNGAADATQQDGTPQPQSISMLPLIAELTSAIQELKAIVDAQAVRIAALENT